MKSVTNGASEASKYQMRQNKPFTVVTYKKTEEPKQHFRCRIHGCRLLEIPDKGYWCPISCGPVPPATRVVFTFNHPSTQGDVICVLLPHKQ
jgi:hypothetical protein